jgi:hypothetical protein
VHKLDDAAERRGTPITVSGGLAQIREGQPTREPVS